MSQVNRPRDAERRIVEIPVKTVKPDDEEDEAWKAHPERPTYHYVFVLDVTESMAACMEEVKLALQQIMADVVSSKTSTGDTAGNGPHDACGDTDGDGDDGEAQVIGSLVCFRDYYTPDTIDDLASGTASGTPSGTAASGVASGGAGGGAGGTDAGAGADMRGFLLELVQEAMPEFLTCTFGPTANFQWLAEQLDGMEAGGGDDWPEAIAEALQAAADAIEESNADRAEGNPVVPVVVLVTDAPPHGLVDPREGEERFPEGTRVNLWDQVLRIKCLFSRLVVVTCATSGATDSGGATGGGGGGGSGGGGGATEAGLIAERRREMMMNTFYKAVGKHVSPYCDPVLLPFVPSRHSSHNPTASAAAANGVPSLLARAAAAAGDELAQYHALFRRRCELLDDVQLEMPYEMPKKWDAVVRERLLPERPLLAVSHDGAAPVYEGAVAALLEADISTMKQVRRTLREHADASATSSATSPTPTRPAANISLREAHPAGAPLPERVLAELVDVGEAAVRRLAGGSSSASSSAPSSPRLAPTPGADLPLSSPALAPPPLPPRPLPPLPPVPVTVDGQAVPAPSQVLPLFRDEWLAATTAVEYAAGDLARAETEFAAASARLAALMADFDAANAAVQSAQQQTQTSAQHSEEADAATFQRFFDCEQRKEELGPALAHDMDSAERKVHDFAGARAAAEARVEENRAAMSAKLRGLAAYVAQMAQGGAERAREEAALEELRRLLAGGRGVVRTTTMEMAAGWGGGGVRGPPPPPPPRRQ